MAIPQQFISESGQPYVHSDIFNFRYEMHDFYNIDATSVYMQKLGDIIDQLSEARNNLKTEAETFLNGKSYQQASKELFTDQGSIRNIAMSVARNPDFINELIRKTTMQKDKLQEYIGDSLSTGIDTDSITEASAQILQKIFQDDNRKSMSMEEFEQKIKKSVSDFHGDFIEDLKKLGRKKITNTQAFKTDLIKVLRGRGLINIDAAWELFKEYFNRYVSTSNITLYKENEKPEDFLKKFENEFKQSLHASKLGDISNAAGWAGEDFKNALWTAQGLEFQFVNVGDQTEEELQKTVYDLWKVKIPKVPFSTNDGKSHSDWVFRNTNGYMVRAQDKNTSVFLKNLKTGANHVQSLKLQDKIAYLSLRQKILNFDSHSLSQEEWKELDYIIANYIWFTNHTTTVKAQNKRGIVYDKNLRGIRETINRILSSEILYFSGVADISKINLNKGYNNTFFVIDNIVLYPTYLILEYIIKQLLAAKDQLNRIQITFNKIGGLKIENAREFYNEKHDQTGTNGSWNKDWKPGDEYGTQVLKVGRDMGADILSKLEVDRINLRFDLQKVLTTAYNINMDEIEKFY